LIPARGFGHIDQLSLGRNPDPKVKQLSRQILEQILELSSAGIVVVDACDPDFPVVYANSAYERRSGYSADELLVGQRLPLLDHGILSQGDVDQLQAALDQGESYEATFVDSHKDGSNWVSQLRVEPLYGPRGALKLFVLTLVPLSEEKRSGANVELRIMQREIKRARQQLAKLDRREPVTGLLRYDYFLELAERDCRMGRRNGRDAAVILLDVVDLDVYRQTFGAKAANSCLRMIAGQVSGALRRSADLCARAGEHSLIALTLGQGIDEVRALAQLIAANVCGLGLHNPRGSHGRHIAVHIGVAGGKLNGKYTLEVAIAQAREDLLLRQPIRKGAIQA
jgi:diguanylate cyclase (GGDEF)-like protein/PAS domain S-box-containing protein